MIISQKSRYSLQISVFGIMIMLFLLGLYPALFYASVPDSLLQNKDSSVVTRIYLTNGANLYKSEELIGSITIVADSKPITVRTIAFKKKAQNKKKNISLSVATFKVKKQKLLPYYISNLKHNYEYTLCQLTRKTFTIFPRNSYQSKAILENLHKITFDKESIKNNIPKWFKSNYIANYIDDKTSVRPPPETNIS